MNLEGRTFALTGPQMLELADLMLMLQRAAVAMDVADVAKHAEWWADHLRREHAGHFGEEGEGS